MLFNGLKTKKLKKILKETKKHFLLTGNICGFTSHWKMFLEWSLNFISRPHGFIFLSQNDKKYILGP